ncbi:MAG: hypothetical protein EXQ92_02730 [Alphaproteobacteria bacterium]|nr:hypothetical protein [Alphaproteobacteria bacterium]
MSSAFRAVVAAVFVLTPLVSLPAKAAPTVLRDTVCPGKPVSLKRLGQEYTLLIDRASLSQSGATLKLQRPNRRDELYTLYGTGERTIATGGTVLRFKPSSDKDNCYEIL